MAEEPSFAGIIERLKTEGELLRNSGTNSIKSLREINLLGFDVLVDQMKELVDFFKGNVLQNEVQLNRNSETNSIESLKEINLLGFDVLVDQTKALVDQMKELVDFFKGNVLQNEENRRELLRVLDSKGSEEEVKPIESIKQTFLQAIKESGFTTFLFTSIYNFIDGLLEGLVVGYRRIFRFIFEPFIRPIRNFIRFLRGDFFRQLARLDPNFRLFQVRLVGFFRKLSEIFKIENTKNILRSARTILRNIGLQLKMGFLFILEDIKSLSKSLAGIIFGREGLKEIRSLIPNLIQVFKELYTALKNIPIIGKVFEVFGDVIKIQRKIFPLFRVLGKLFGRFIPFVNLIFAVFDAFSGAFQALERVKDKSFFSKIFAMIIGAISGLVQGFAGEFLDLLKNILSWVFKKVGLGEVSKILDSFSFKEIFKNFFDTIIDTFVNSFERIIDDFKNLSLGKALYNLLIEAIGMFLKLKRAFASTLLLPIQGIAKVVSKVTGEDSLAGRVAGRVDRFLSPEGSFGVIDQAVESLRFDNPNSVNRQMEVGMNNTSGAQMEVGMSDIADSRFQPTSVFVSGSSSPQTINSNTSSVTINDSGHREESSFMYQTAMGAY